jgi:hypothetical protein
MSVDDALRVLARTRTEGRAPPEPASPLDTPDTRTSEREPAPLHAKGVQEGELDTAGQAPRLARRKNILRLFARDVRRAGLAGETRLAQLVYLAITSRLLRWGKAADRPVSVIAKGTTSSGKSYATKITLRFFPPSAYIDLGSMSRRYLFYTEEEFAHRVLYVPEWASIREDEELVAMLRTLLSEGRIIHGTVEGEGKRKARRIEKNGPTGLLMTTTDAAVDGELETRCLSILTDDSAEQTRRVYVALAALEHEADPPVDLAAWHEFQEWLASFGETRVVVPFAFALADLMPTSATRLRRDFVTVLCLIRAHSILYRAQREQDEGGRIVATIQGDYAPVRRLVGDLIAEGVEAGVSRAMRETVEAVRAIVEDGSPYASPSAIVKRLGVGKSATYDRIRRAQVAGYIVNEAPQGERAKRLVVGIALPGEREFLPAPAALVRWLSGCPPGQKFRSTTRPRGAMSGFPAFPADPQETQAGTTAPTRGDAIDEDENEQVGDARAHRAETNDDTKEE